MKKINYKLIVSDFDGTLIDDNQQIPQKVVNAINEYVACGGVFAVCTGRMLRAGIGLERFSYCKPRCGYC